MTDARNTTPAARLPEIAAPVSLVPPPWSRPVQAPDAGAGARGAAGLATSAAAPRHRPARSPLAARPPRRAEPSRPGAHPAPMPSA